MGGSSAGLRQLLKSSELAGFMNENEHMNMEVYLKRGRHPYISQTYINGYVKEVPLRMKNKEDCFKHITMANEEFGRRPMDHNQHRVLGNPSIQIQGGWNTNEDRWQNYPKHLMEAKPSPPVSYFEPKPLKEVRDKKKNSDYFTKFMRKKFPLDHSVGTIGGTI
uniref:Large ribosomal subunit protein mL43 n=1 Tax=Strombidium inclinatum TaxID=197538 RepID=A0A7S3MX02_9SPIT|mmetsp:Transcript_23100/g.35774  ORF Transcript_23100/g.35774 Transcript_23100/m.35774 type:complete len:164 (+) Transcript_23100:67-558(+)